MAKIWLISDTHFEHSNVLTFTKPDGERLRPFDSLKEMHECMVTCWNETVKPEDKVYHLGDFAMRRSGVPWAKVLNGHKRLILGNHDTADIRDYLDCGFEKVLGYRVLDRLVLSHIPVHEHQVAKRFKGNIHGHLHGQHLADLHYYNVSVEVIDYVPVDFEQIRAYFNGLRSMECE